MATTAIIRSATATMSKASAAAAAPAAAPKPRVRRVRVPTATPAPVAAPVAAALPVAAPVAAPVALRDVWVKGIPVGINHVYGQRGARRFKTPAAINWESAVESTIALSARVRRLYGAVAWGVDDSKRGATQLGVTLRFIIQTTRHRTRPDADAAQKMTLDAIARGLGLDDRVVKRVTSAITITNEPLTGCLITIERLNAADCVAEDEAVIARARASERSGRL